MGGECERSLFVDQTEAGGIHLRYWRPWKSPRLSLLVSVCRNRSLKRGCLHHLAVSATLFFVSYAPLVTAFPPLDRAQPCFGPDSCSSHVDFSIYSS